MTTSLDETFFQKIRDGDAYITSELKNVPSGGDFNIHIENPANSGYRLLMRVATVESKVEATVHVHDEFDSISTGTELKTHSSLSEQDSPPFNAYQDSTYTAKNKHNHSIIGSGGGTGNASGGDASATLLVIRPGDDMVLHVHNDSSNSGDMSMKIVTVLIQT